MSNLEPLFNKIENFNAYFSESYVAPEYAKAWEMNKRHGIYLHSLPRPSADYLAKLVRENEPGTILEIGTSIGWSALHLARAAAIYGGKVYTIEKALPKAEIARVHFEESGLGNIEQLIGKAAEVLPAWIASLPGNMEIDFLFIDADKKHYKDLFIMLEPHLSENTIVAADNISNFRDEVKDFVNYLENNPSYRTEIVERDNGMLVASKVAA